MPNLSTPIATYFDLTPEADTADLAGVFAEDAVVHDAAREHRGLTAIREWRIETMARTPFTARPLSSEERDGVVVVRAEVSGTFPGSPVTLAHDFTIRDGRVAALGIK